MSETTATLEPTVLPTYSDVTTAFTHREVPWMKMGKLVDHAPTAKDAARLGGIDFTVSLRALSYSFGNGRKTAPLQKAIVRDDTGEALGIVSSRSYQVLQYSEAFDFMDTVDSRYVAAGALKGGRQGFIVVKAPFQLNVLGGEDQHDLYAVLRTSHDRSRATEVMVMPLRGRCMNQLTLASFSRDVPHRWAIKHAGRMWEKLAEAKSSLSNLANYATRFEEITSQLADINVTEGLAREVLTKVIPGRAKQEDVINTILGSWETAETIGYRGNGWGLLNAVSEHYDWTRAGGTPESRFLNALEGQTHKVINKTVVHLLRARASV